MFDLEKVTIESIFAIFMVFCRFGSVMIILPGIGESYVSVRSRLLFSVATSIMLVPVVENLPPMPITVSELFVTILIEITVGIFIGSIARLLLTSMHVLGTVIATVSGLGSAALFDPNQSSQGSMIGNLMGGLVISLLFLTDTHHLIFKGIVDSYSLFPAGKFLLTGDILDLIAKTASNSFNIAIKLSSPHIVISIIMMVGAGVISRVMPAVQIFFLITPVQVLVSFIILMITLSATIMWYMEYFEQTFTGFILIN